MRESRDKAYLHIWAANVNIPTSLWKWYETNLIAYLQV